MQEHGRGEVRRCQAPEELALTSVPWPARGSSDRACLRRRARSTGSSARCSRLSSRSPIFAASPPCSTKRLTRLGYRHNLKRGGFPLLHACFTYATWAFLRLRDGLIADVGAGSKEVDVLKWMGRAALELLGQGALGYSFHPLVDDTSNDSAEAVKSFLYARTTRDLPTQASPKPDVAILTSTAYSAALNALSVFRLIAMPVWVLEGKLPSPLHSMVLDAIPSRRVQRMKRIVRTMRQRSDEIIAEKPAALQKGDESAVRQLGEGKDIMSILRTCYRPRLPSAVVAINAL